MAEFEYYSDEDSYRSESDDEPQTEAKNFQNAYDNRQIQTLKFFRQALKENQSLKKRLIIVESELEKFEGIRPFSPLKDQSSFMTQTSPVMQDEDNTSKSTQDKYSQCDFITDLIQQIKNSHESKNDSIVQVEKPKRQSYKTVETQVEISETLKVNKEVQSECLIEVEKINELNEKLESLQREKSEQEKNSNALIIELRINNEVLSEKVASLVKECDALSKSLKESDAENSSLSYVNEELKSLRERNNELEVNMEAMYLDIKKKETVISNRNEEIAKLKENVALLKENFKVIDDQRAKIEYLMAENEKHLKEKHVICQQKISELTQECVSNVKVIQEQKSEINFLNGEIKEMTAQVEKMRKEQQNFNFKEFVTLKRELNSLKLEREKMFAEAMSTPSTVFNQQPPLPPIKDSKKNIFNFFKQK